MLLHNEEKEVQFASFTVYFIFLRSGKTINSPSFPPPCNKKIPVFVCDSTGGWDRVGRGLIPAYIKGGGRDGGETDRINITQQQRRQQQQQRRRFSLSAAAAAAAAAAAVDPPLFPDTETRTHLFLPLPHRIASAIYSRVNGTLAFLEKSLFLNSF